MVRDKLMCQLDQHQHTITPPPSSVKQTNLPRHMQHVMRGRSGSTSMKWIHFHSQQYRTCHIWILHPISFRNAQVIPISMSAYRRFVRCGLRRDNRGQLLPEESTWETTTADLHR